MRDEKQDVQKSDKKEGNVAFQIERNMNEKDRTIRLVIMVLLLIYAVWATSWLALLLAFFVMFEVFYSWCLFYQLFGINHCPRK